MVNAYLPTWQQLTRETIAVLAATLVAAWVIAQWPAAQRLVRGNSIPSPFDQQ
ncbi:MAG TPA: hypothetical protein VGE10_01715 [Zeimonas sp.]